MVPPDVVWFDDDDDDDAETTERLDSAGEAISGAASSGDSNLTFNTAGNSCVRETADGRMELLGELTLVLLLSLSSWLSGSLSKWGDNSDTSNPCQVGYTKGLGAGSG